MEEVRPATGACGSRSERFVRGDILRNAVGTTDLLRDGSASAETNSQRFARAVSCEKDDAGGAEGGERCAEPEALPLARLASETPQDDLIARDELAATRDVLPKPLLHLLGHLPPPPLDLLLHEP